MAVSDWDATAANNTSIDGTDIAEGCSPSGLNNAVRSVMAAVRSFWNAAYRNASPGSSGNTITIIEDGGTLPASPVDGDIVIEYTP